MYLSILKNSKHYSIESQCKALEISRNSFYNWKKNYEHRLQKKSRLLLLILEIYWDSHGTYGSPRITASLHNQNISISTKTVSKYMKLLGISSIHSSHFPKHISRMNDSEKSLIQNLILNLDITRPNQVWTTDITYIPTIHDGTLYLISFIDQFSKRVVGWNLCRRQKAEDITHTLLLTLKKRKPLPGLIVHSDKGSQFRSKLYRTTLIQNHYIYSYTEFNHSCDQNAAQESFHASLKKEWLSTHKLYYWEDSYKTIFDYIEGFYNPKRLHSSLGYVSPISFEKDYTNRNFSSKTPSKHCTKY